MDRVAQTVHCFHCGLAVPDGESSSALIDGSSRPMCCPGCAAAASLITASGLGNYYHYRTAQAGQPDSSRPDDSFLVYDDPGLQRSFVIQQPGGLACAQLSIDGIRCTACVWLLEQYLKQQAGVDTVNVHFAEQRAAIEFRPAETSVGRLMAQIARLGYSPRPFRPVSDAARARDEDRQYLLRLGVAGLLMMQTGMYAIGLYAGAFQGIESGYRDLMRLASLLLSVPVVAYAAQPFFIGAWRGLRAGMPGMDLPVAIAIACAFIASCLNTWRGSGEVYFDSVAMFTFFLLLARYLEIRSRRQAGRSSHQLLAALPDVATRLGDDSSAKPVAAVDLRIGDRILVRQGEHVPADAVVTGGHSGIDESALTGESRPVRRGPGDAIIAGTVNVDAPLEARVTALGMDTRIGAIMRLVDRAQAERPAIVLVADRIARHFVTVVLLLAAGAGLYWSVHEATRSLSILLAILVVSCPCALSLATPVALTAANTALKQHGLLISRGHVLETLAAATTVLLDKTGTLTEAGVTLASWQTVHGNDDPDYLLNVASALEARSAHPLARAFRHGGETLLAVSDWHAVPSQGIQGTVHGVRYRIGRAEFAAPISGLEVPSTPGAGRWALLAGEQGSTMWLQFTDSLRPTAAAAVAALQRLGLRTVLLSGDHEDEVARVATALHIDNSYAGATPETKLALLRSLQSRGERLVMVGDGINDLPAQAGADVSIAVADAADIGKARADCLLLGGDLTVIAAAVHLARRTRRIVRQNLCWALAYNLAAIPFAAAGLVPPWLAAVGMSASSLVVVGNARRLSQWKACSS